jgi:hypothetical protein
VEPTTDLSGDAPTVAINTGLLPAMAQHCTRCGAQLADDQRYCVQCGERRGEPRLPFMDGGSQTPAAVVTEAAAAVPSPPAPTPRWGAGATLIAGVGTLLLALGVGVLIGNAGKGDDNNTAAVTPQVITVQGGGGVAAAGTDTTATTATNAGKGSGSKDAKVIDTADAETRKDAKAVVAAPSGSEIPRAETPVVEQGQKGEGPGYKDGKFTGDFFGP